MSEELQNDDFQIDEGEAYDAEPNTIESNENPEKGPELATDAEEPAEKVDDTEEAKEEKRKAAFNKEYAKKKQAERERDALKAELDRFKQQAATPTPQVGKMPDQYDYDTDAEYQTAYNQFIGSVQAAERHRLISEAQSTQYQNAQIAEQQAKQEEQDRKLKAYTDKSKEYGITPDELQSAAKAVYEFGITQDLEMALISHEDGAVMTKYLASNPLELDKMNKMSPIEVALHLVNDVSKKAAALKPKTSSTPSPTTDIQGGGGSLERDDPLIEGAMYE